MKQYVFLPKDAKVTSSDLFKAKEAVIHLIMKSTNCSLEEADGRIRDFLYACLDELSITITPKVKGESHVH